MKSIKGIELFTHHFNFKQSFRPKSATPLPISTYPSPAHEHWKYLSPVDRCAWDDLVEYYNVTKKF